MNLTDIKPYEKNAKKHPKKQVEQIAASIKEFGFNQPIVVDKDNIIIVGHGRYEAAKVLGLKDVPTIQVNLSEEHARAYRLADNKLNESEWDMGLAIEELKGLSDEMFDLTGFDRDLIIEPDEKDDIIPEDVPPRSKLGDLYKLGNHRVLCGDSTKIEDVERLMDGKKADMVFTDPPYGVNYDGGTTLRERLKGDKNTLIYDSVLPILKNNSKSSAAFFIWYAQSKSAAISAAISAAGLEERKMIIWNKDKAQFGALSAQYKDKYEPVLYAYVRGQKPKWYGPTDEVSVWECKRALKNEFHPTQKPIELAVRAFNNHTEQDDIVLDLFLGSGSTLIASEKTGRICYGMELEPKYVDVIIQRYVDYTGNEKVIKNGAEELWKKTKEKTKV